MNAVKILPVKIHKSNGSGTLFGVLCAIAYAKDRGANIVNASFGFYAARNRLKSEDKVDSSVYLLKQFVKKYLTDNNILFVAAAGNTDDFHEDQVYRPSNPLMKRNLDSVSFYPASLSRELANVIGVTTVFNARVSGSQNYSPKVVHAGVNADELIQGKQVFKNPYIQGKSVDGSSFATPIVTGKVAAHYHLFNPNNVTRNEVLSVLKGKLLLKEDTTAKDTILNGNIIIR